MPRTKQPQTNVEALKQVEDAVTRVLTLISAVLRKFPANTLPEKLKPFRYAHFEHAVRRSTKDQEIVLIATSFFYKNATLRFPLALLDAPEQEITRWARDQYWSGIEGSKFQARQDARMKVGSARETLEKAQRDYDAAQAHLTAVWSARKKKRQRAERGSAS